VRYRRLGRTELQVSEVGFGAWAIGGNAHGHSYGPTDNRESLRAVARAFDLGCTFFDTADVYGHGLSEKLLGQALAKHRSACVIATKAGCDFYHGPFRKNFDPGYIREALDKSLQRLRMDYVDLYQLHNPPLMMLERGEHYEVLDDLKQQGKIRHYGVSVHDAYEGSMAVHTGKPDAIQVEYNLLRQDPDEELFPQARDSDVGLIIRSPLCSGVLSGNYKADSVFDASDVRASWPPGYLALQADVADSVRSLATERRTLAQTALRFVLDAPEISVVIPGIKTAAQAEENLAVSELPKLAPEEREAIRNGLEEVGEDFL
jgi:aryl-alcohol dehydrogenase-like predicted oxidoreductase